MDRWGNKVITLNDFVEFQPQSNPSEPQSNLSEPTNYSDLSSEFINSNQEMIISSPSVEDHSYQYLEQEEEENCNTQDAPIIPADTEEARPRIHEDNRQKQNEQEANCYIRNSAAAADEIIPIETEPSNLTELKQIVIELQRRYPDYAKCFLSCQRCVSFGILRPHCKCGGLHGCVQMCPDLTKCTKEKGKRQMSHCPTCFNIGKGISGHKTLSSVIDVYICANCEDFHSRWNSLKNKNKLEGLKCDSNLGRKGNCLQDHQLVPARARFCTWCRLKLMQILGFKMTDEVKPALQHTDPEQRKRLQAVNSKQRNLLGNNRLAIVGSESENRQQLEQNHSNCAQSSESEVDDSNVELNLRKRRANNLLAIEENLSINDSFNFLNLNLTNEPRKKRRDSVSVETVRDRDNISGGAHELENLEHSRANLDAGEKICTNENDRTNQQGGINFEHFASESQPQVLNSNSEQVNAKNNANMPQQRTDQLREIDIEHDASQSQPSMINSNIEQVISEKFLTLNTEENNGQIEEQMPAAENDSDEIIIEPMITKNKNADNIQSREILEQQQPVCDDADSADVESIIAKNKSTDDVQSQTLETRPLSALSSASTVSLADDDGSLLNEMVVNPFLLMSTNEDNYHQKEQQEMSKSIVAELQLCYPNYTKYFLSCQRCVSFGILRPHCKCGGLHGCVQMCPDLTKCTKINRQLSHCPTCFNIGKGISGHKKLSSVIDVYICANCEDFFHHWNFSKYKGKLEKLKCASGKSNCLQDRQLNEKPAGPTFFCLWCRLKLMQLLRFEMTDEVKQALQHHDPEQRKLRNLNLPDRSLLVDKFISWSSNSGRSSISFQAGRATDEMLDDVGYGLLGGLVNDTLPNSSRLSGLHEAAFNGCLKSATAILLGKAENVNKRDEEGRTALFYAYFGIKGPNRAMIKFLEGRGASPRIRDIFSRTVTDYAISFANSSARFGKTFKHNFRAANVMDVISSLRQQIYLSGIQRHIDEERQKSIEDAIKTIDSDLTDFHHAAKYSEFALTLTLSGNERVNLNAKSLFGRTALHFAAMAIQKNAYSPLIYQILHCVEGIDTEQSDLFELTADDYLKASILSENTSE